MVTINPQRIFGRWKSGWALDLHTTSSVRVGNNEAGHTQFETIRPEIAELLYKLKYRGHDNAAAPIIEAAAVFLFPHKKIFDFLIPVPPSSQRLRQPVAILAHGISTSIGVPLLDCIETTRETTPLKGVTDVQNRKALVDGLYTIKARLLEGKQVLLFDDLFRSGTTMNAITDTLYDQGRAQTVYALTITKTRSNQ